MNTFYRPTWVEISLDALSHNIQEFRRMLQPNIRLMSVVKADAYGHGAIGIAREAIACGVDYLAVAILEEALELRNAGIEAPILVLGYTPAEGLQLAALNRITLNVFSKEVLDVIIRDNAFYRNHPLKIHIKMDTGMSRLGLPTEVEAIHFIERALDVEGLEVEGLFTHYASADQTDMISTMEQHRRFTQVIQHFANKNVTFPYLHAGNSATAIVCPDFTLNMVRLGIGMYGLYPSEELDNSTIELQPVLSLKTGIVMNRRLPEGSGVSYGSVYRTGSDEQIATLPIGYADGFSRMLTGRAEALIHGSRVPVVGRICMDQCMINVTGIPDISVGDEVVLIGKQGGERITVGDLAHQLGTINYEVTCMISHRVPRVYIRNGVKLV